MAEKSDTKISGEKQDGRLIIDEFDALERIINRWKTILEASQGGVFNDERRREILEDDGTKALNELCRVIDEFKRKWSVKEYVDEVMRKYHPEAA